MENYANAMPTIFFEEDQRMQHQRQQRQQTKKHLKSIRRSRPDCFTVVPEYLKKNQHQLETSSSSSSSDSEDELNASNFLKSRKRFSQKQIGRRSRPDCFTVVPEYLKKNQYQLETSSSSSSSDSEDELNASNFLKSRKRFCQKQIGRRSRPECFTVMPEYLKKKQHQLENSSFSSSSSSSSSSDSEDEFYTNKRYSRYQQQQQQRYFPTGFPFHQMEKDFQQTSTTSNSLLKVTEIIRDETTGKPLMLVKVNTFGFRAEEIRVRVDETKRVLIVEAIKRNIREGQMQMEQGLTMKYLRREFVLPQWLNVTRITFRVLKNGLLIIKLPIVKQNKMLHNTNFTTRFGCENKTFGAFNMQKQHKKEWEKPLRA